MNQVSPLSSTNTEPFTQDFFSMVSSIMYNSFGFFFLDFLIPFVAMILDASGAVMGVLFALRTVGYLLSSSFVGILTDRYQKKVLVAFGSVGRGLSYFLMYIAIIFSSLDGLAIGTTFLGFCAGFYWIPLNTLVAEKSHKNNRSQAYGYRTSAQARGELFGGIIGFSLLSTASSMGLSDVIAYAALPIFGLANFYAGYLFIARVNEYDKINSLAAIDINIKSNNTTKIGELSRFYVIGLITILLVMFLASVNGSIARPFLIPYFIGQISNDATIATLVYVPSGIVSLFLATRLGQLADKMNPYLGITIGSFSGALMTYLLINTNDIIVFALLLTFDVTIALTTGLVLMNMISRITVAHRGKILGFQQASSNIGNIVGPILGGILWDAYSVFTPFLISIVVEILLHTPLYYCGSSLDSIFRRNL